MQKHSLMSTKDWLFYKYLMLASNPGFSLSHLSLNHLSPLIISHVYVVSSCLNKLDLLHVFQDIKLRT